MNTVDRITVALFANVSSLDDKQKKGVTVLLLLLVTYKLFGLLFGSKKRHRKMDEATRALLAKGEEVEKDCAPVVKLLLTFKTVQDEATCAGHMREIVMSKALPYESLASNPAALLGASRHFSPARNGALGTRFTVQYNLFAGSIVAMGSDDQRERLYKTQLTGDLGCFAFTERGAGVLSGAGVETTAHFDKASKTFTINSPTDSSCKNWISQGLYSEHAVILADLYIDGERKGPHLFFTRIQNRNNETGKLTPVSGVSVSSLPEKVALRGLDNASIMFSKFKIPRSELLSRFSAVDSEGKYSLTLPPGVTKMLDLLLSRLLTGRVCLSEFTIQYALELNRVSFDYCTKRELWKGRKDKGDKMSEKYLINQMFVDYSRTLHMVAHYIGDVREKVAQCILDSRFPPSILEAVCVSKFVGTSFGVDAMSVTRKQMGSFAIFEANGLGMESFVGNCTCAAEGDNTVMEGKVVMDLFRNKNLFPFSLLLKTFLRNSLGRSVVKTYLRNVIYAFLNQKEAQTDGQLVRDIAWCRAHMLILDSWYSSKAGSKGKPGWEESYGAVLNKFPTPAQF